MELNKPVKLRIPRILYFFPCYWKITWQRQLVSHKIHFIQLVILTWPYQIAPSTSSLFPQFCKRTGSPASLADGSGRNHKTTGEKKWVLNRWQKKVCGWQTEIRKRHVISAVPTNIWSNQVRPKRSSTCFNWIRRWSQTQTVHMQSRYYIPKITTAKTKTKKKATMRRCVK